MKLCNFLKFDPNYSRVGLMAGGKLEDLDSRQVVHHLTKVMEGGREAFQYRQTICQAHWPGSVSAD